MAIGAGRFDPELQMFADQPREPDLTHLQFLRWLGERGRLEHDPLGPAGGEYAGRARAEGLVTREARPRPPAPARPERPT